MHHHYQYEEPDEYKEGAVVDRKDGCFIVVPLEKQGSWFSLLPMSQKERKVIVDKPV